MLACCLFRCFLCKFCNIVPLFITIQLLLKDYISSSVSSLRTMLTTHFCCCCCVQQWKYGLNLKRKMTMMVTSCSKANSHCTNNFSDNLYYWDGGPKGSLRPINKFQLMTLYIFMRSWTSNNHLCSSLSFALPLAFFLPSPHCSGKDLFNHWRLSVIVIAYFMSGPLCLGWLFF